MCLPEIQVAMLHQRWNILTPLRKQKLGLPLPKGANQWRNGPRIFCMQNRTINALDRLYNPLDSSRQSRANVDTGMKPQLAMMPSFLERLPPEILREILSTLGVRDTICLGLSSRTLWSHTVWIIRDLYSTWRKNFSWAGTPIILAGSNLTMLPQAMYDLFPETKLDHELSHDFNLVDFICCKPPPRYWVRTAMEDYDEASSPVHGSYQNEFRKLFSSSGIPKELHSAMASCLDPYATASGGKWYLRNHTTKEYTRMEFVRDLTDARRTTVALVGNRWLTLDILLMWLIGWSVNQYSKKKYPSWGDEDDNESEVQWDNLLRGRMSEDTLSRLSGPFDSMNVGKWAGHSLDVVDGEFEQMRSDWHDCTGTVEKLSRGWFMALHEEELRDRDVPH